jgi:hypothetical protein
MEVINIGKKTLFNISNEKLLIFKIDVIDMLYSIINSIDKKNIKTEMNYNLELKKLISDFDINKVNILITKLRSDMNLQDNEDIYKYIINYSNEIYDMDIMKHASRISISYV